MGHGLALLAAIALGGCQESADLESIHFACATDADCKAGNVCHTPPGVCLPPGADPALEIPELFEDVHEPDATPDATPDVTPDASLDANPDGPQDVQAPGCPGMPLEDYMETSMYADGRCDGTHAEDGIDFNMEGCAFDGGDCCVETNPHCATDPTYICECKGCVDADCELGNTICGLMAGKVRQASCQDVTVKVEVPESGGEVTCRQWVISPEVCITGSCAAGDKVCADPAVECNDGNPCTDDTWDGVKCANTNNTADCDDGNACTQNTTCADGSCQDGESVACDDGTPCTEDTCSVELGCQWTLDSLDESPCDDEDPCTEDTTCIEGGCGGGQALPDGAWCGDGMACGGSANVCVEATPSITITTFTDGETLNLASSACAQDVGEEDPATCVADLHADLVAIPDGSEAVLSVACDQDDPVELETATEDVAANWQAIALPHGSTCILSASSAGEQSGAVEVTVDRVPPSVTIVSPTNGFQSNWANDADATADGHQVSVVIDVADVKSGTTLNLGYGLAVDGVGGASWQEIPIVLVKDAPAGQPDTLAPSAITLGPQTWVFQASLADYAGNTGMTEVVTVTVTDDCGVDCDDEDPCTTDSCDKTNGACLHAPSTGQPCDDEQYCTVDDVCAAGSCEGQTRDCSVGVNQCQINLGCDEVQDECATGSKMANTPCNADSDGCTQSDYCSSGVCLVGGAVDCSLDDTQCAVGSCVSTSSSGYSCDNVPLSEGTPCQDGLYCTEADTCDGAGTCAAGPPQECNADLSECDLVVCTEEAQGCQIQSVSNGTSCSSVETCDYDEICLGGLCQAGGWNCEDRTLSFAPLVGTATAPAVVGLEEGGFEVYFSEAYGLGNPGDPATESKIRMRAVTADWSLLLTQDGPLVDFQATNQAKIRSLDAAVWKGPEGTGLRIVLAAYEGQHTYDGDGNVYAQHGVRALYLDEFGAVEHELDLATKSVQVGTDPVPPVSAEEWYGQYGQAGPAAIGALATSDFVACWFDDPGIQCRVYDAELDDNPIDPANPTILYLQHSLTDDPDMGRHGLDVTGLDDDRYALAYWKDDAIEVVIFDPYSEFDGVIPSSPLSVASGPGKERRHVAIAANPSGDRIAVVWSEEGQEGWNVRMQLVNVTAGEAPAFLGETWFSTTRAETHTSRTWPPGPTAGWPSGKTAPTSTATATAFTPRSSIPTARPPRPSGG